MNGLFAFKNLLDPFFSCPAHSPDVHDCRTVQKDHDLHLRFLLCWTASINEFVGDTC